VDLEPDLQPQTSTTWTSSLVNQMKGKIRSLINQDSRSQVEDYNVYIEAYKLFVDLASPYPDRLGILKSFWVLDESRHMLCCKIGYSTHLIFSTPKKRWSVHLKIGARSQASWK
jgi:hypothetical protein